MKYSRLDATDKLAVKVIHNFAEKRRSQIINGENVGLGSMTREDLMELLGV